MLFFYCLKPPEALCWQLAAAAAESRSGTDVCRWGRLHAAVAPPSCHPQLGASVWLCLEGDPHAEQGYRLLVGFGAEEGLGFIA